MTPQAMRLPALPVGSVFMSSAFSWTMMDVPPLAVMLLGMGISVGLSRRGVRVRLDEVLDEV